MKNLVQAKYVDENHKEFVKFCNSLRCPLCQSQLDGSIFPTIANLYCVGNNQEYTCSWSPSSKAEPIKEIIRHWYPQYEYEIIINKEGSGYTTLINRYNRDVTEKYKHSTRQLIFKYSGSRILFFRKAMQEKDFINKLKTYNVFS